MKKIISLAIVAVNLVALNFHIKTFSADFTQTINGSKHTQIRYSGTIQAKLPGMIKWSYKKPIQKTVYVNNNQITIIQPLIQQAIVTRINNTLPFFNILKNAKQMSPNQYQSFFNKTKIYLTTDNNKIISITYHDQLQNKITIIFTHQEQNKPIPKYIFHATIPSNYDLINR